MEGVNVFNPDLASIVKERKQEIKNKLKEKDSEVLSFLLHVQKKLKYMQMLSL